MQLFHLIFIAMRKKVLSYFIVSAFLSIQALSGQNPVAALQHIGSSSVFHGQNSLVEAYNSSVNGDTIYLSAGYFNSPSVLAKGIKIIGSGHFPDESDSTGAILKRTVLISSLTINKGADSLRLEGLFINGDINFEAANKISYVKALRCRIGSMGFNSTSTTAAKNNITFEECVILGNVSFSRYGNNLSFSHCILNGYIADIDGNALIERCVFLFGLSYNAPLINIFSSNIRDNIFVGNYSPFSNCTGNSFSNNLYRKASFDFGLNAAANNYFGLSQADIFVNQAGNEWKYEHDYHLKSPTTYLGTDGTQVGLYGGSSPFKEKGVPANPQIISKSIGKKTDANGNLSISVSVKAQDK